MDVLSRRFEAITENLANAETPGFKRIVGSEISRLERAGPAVHAESLVEVHMRDHRQGLLVKNGDSRQLALDGSGLFAVEHEGDVAYTRSVRVWIDDDGTLVDQRGLPLLGDGGPIRVPPGRESELNVAKDGTVQLGNDRLGKLSINEFESTGDLQEAGPGLFRTDPSVVPKPADSARVLQGWRERSNVEPMQEMISMIQLQRQFDMSRRAIDQSMQLTEQLTQSLRR